MRFARDVSSHVFFMDEGIICEEGTPEQVFDAPRKDKTRQFINRLRVFEASLHKNSPDCSGLISGLEQFGFRYMISRRRQCPDENGLFRAGSKPAGGGRRPLRHADPPRLPESGLAV